LSLTPNFLTPDKQRAAARFNREAHSAKMLIFGTSPFYEPSMTVR
jgi:hypothetical protein